MIAVVTAWIAGFLSAGVWHLSQPLWYAVCITACGLICLPLMAVMAWHTAGDQAEEDKS